MINGGSTRCAFCSSLPDNSCVISHLNLKREIYEGVSQNNVLNEFVLKYAVVFSSHISEVSSVNQQMHTKYNERLSD